MLISDHKQFPGYFISLVFLLTLFTETLDRESRLRKAYRIFNDAGHSGMSAALTMAMLRRFCPDGNELADACKEFRYSKSKE